MPEGFVGFAAMPEVLGAGFVPELKNLQVDILYTKRQNDNWQ